MVQTYERAARLTSHGIHEKLVFEHTVNPNWLVDARRFWFINQEPDGKRFLLVNPDDHTVTPAFDHKRLAGELSQAIGKQLDERSLPILNIQFVGHSALLIDTVEGRWQLNLGTYELLPANEKGPVRAGGTLSPDGKWSAFVRDSNLWIKSMDGGREIQLTTDGRRDFAYATPPDALVHQETSGLGLSLPPAAAWSPDSAKLFTHQVDQTKVEELVVLRFLTKSGRPAASHLRYPLPGEENVPTLAFVVIDIREQSVVRVKHEPFPIAYFPSPILMGRSWWSSDSAKTFVLIFGRGDRSKTLFEVDAVRGSVRPLIKEESDTPVFDAPARGPSCIQIVDDGSEIIWWSEQNGWGHLSLYDGEGNFKNQITSGDWVVREIIRVDKEERAIFFAASGREEGDPYLRHLYRVDFDGENLRRLDDEVADHHVITSPDGDFFLDSYSTVSTPPKTVVRNREGEVILEVAEADTRLLEEGGWVWPERFRVKAADGKTDIWGTMFRPSNFNPEVKYPLIDDVYPGVNVLRGWPSWPDAGPGRQAFANAPSIAELGFVVVTIDGRGGPLRSRAFRELGFGKMGDGPWLEDHIAAIKQLGERYSYLDLSRVGIYGHSLGGFASAHALLKHPSFFKAAVSSAGSHDHRYLWYGISELQQGLDAAKQQGQNNIELAHRLEGKLLLIHGTFDFSVGIHMTMLLIDALIKANKDFEFLPVPDAGHGLLGARAYVLKRHWDFFVRHLLAQEPPTEFMVPEPKLRVSPGQ